MPQMGESVFEGTITKWLKNVGDQVTRDEPLFEISTDKVDAEIPAPASGVLTAIKAETGTTVQVNSVVAVIGGTRHRRRIAPAPAGKACGNRREARGRCARNPSGSPRAAAASGEEVRSSPLVRKLASEHNVDLRHVTGSGAGGRVTRDDILAFVERAKAAPALHCHGKACTEKIAAAARSRRSQQVCGHARSGRAHVCDAQEDCRAHDRLTAHQRARAYRLRS